MNRDVSPPTEVVHRRDPAPRRAGPEGSGEWNSFRLVGIYGFVELEEKLEEELIECGIRIVESVL